jgi:hypothetical protein
MLRRVVCFAVAAAAAVLLLAIPANAQWSGNNHFGQSWGTYVHKVEGMPVPALVTINFGGTLTVTSGFMFGSGYPMRLSPIHGVWEQKSFRSIVATSLFLNFDDKGVITSYQRNRCVMNFADDFNSYKGFEYMETAACGPAGCPDPLAPATVWTPFQGMPSTGFPVSGARLQLVPLNR